MGLQEDLTLEGCGRYVGRFLAQNCPWGHTCCCGWLTILHELSIVSGLTLVLYDSRRMVTVLAGKIYLILHLTCDAILSLMLSILPPTAARGEMTTSNVSHRKSKSNAVPRGPVQPSTPLICRGSFGFVLYK